MHRENFLYYNKCVNIYRENLLNYLWKTIIWLIWWDHHMIIWGNQNLLLTSHCEAVNTGILWKTIIWASQNLLLTSRCEAMNTGTYVLHTYIHAYIHTYILCVHVCMYVYMHACLHACMGHPSTQDRWKTNRRQRILCTYIFDALSLPPASCFLQQRSTKKQAFMSCPESAVQEAENYAITLSMHLFSPFLKPLPQSPGGRATYCSYVHAGLGSHCELHGILYYGFLGSPFPGKQLLQTRKTVF